jgi:hypothetical protein
LYAKTTLIHPDIKDKHQPIGVESALFAMRQDHFLNYVMLLTKESQLSTDYTGVRTVFFNKFDEIPFDIFIKLSEEKYVKALKVGDQMTDEFINKYVSKKVFEFFLTNEVYQEFKELIFDFHSSAKIILVKGREIRVPDNNNLNHMMEELGVPQKETRKINEMSTRIVSDLNNEDKSVSKLLENFTSSNERFIYDHSYLTAVISCQLANANEWGTNPNKEKLCLASILHELRGSHNDNMTIDAHIKQQELNNGISPELLENVKLLTSQLRQIDAIPIDVVSILENSLNFTQPTLSPMTCCFVVAHQYVIELYKEEFDNSNNPDIFDRLSSLFPSANLNKQVKNLIKQFTK